MISWPKRFETQLGLIKTKQALCICCKQSRIEYFPANLSYFFNIVLDTGILPDAWLKGMIKLIYKNKGNPDDPNSYRPITITNTAFPLQVLNRDN